MTDEDKKTGLKNDRKGKSQKCHRASRGRQKHEKPWTLNLPHKVYDFWWVLPMGSMYRRYRYTGGIDIPVTYAKHYSIFIHLTSWKNDVVRSLLELDVSTKRGIVSNCIRHSTAKPECLPEISNWVSNSSSVARMRGRGKTIMKEKRERCRRNPEKKSSKWR